MPDIIADLLIQLRASDQASAELKAVDKNFDELNKTTEKNVTQTNKAGVAADGLKGKMSSLSSTFVAGIVAMGAAIAAAAITSFFMDSTKKAADFEMQIFSMGKVFGESSTAMIEKSKQMASGTIYHNTEIMASMMKVNDSFSRYGISADQSMQVITLGMDVAASKGLELREAIDRIESAMRGEAEASEYLGFTLGDNYMKNIALNGAYKDRWEKMSDAEKAQARYNEILEQSIKYEGSAADATETFSGKMKVLGNQVEDMQIKVGSMLIPVISGLLDIFGDTYSELANELGPEMQEMNMLFSEVAELTLPILRIALELIIETFKIMVTQFQIVVNIVLGGVDIMMGAFGALAKLVKGDVSGAQQFLNEKMTESAGHFIRSAELTGKLTDQYMGLIPEVYGATVATDTNTISTDILNTSTKTLTGSQKILSEKVLDTAGALTYLSSEGTATTQTFGKFTVMSNEATSAQAQLMQQIDLARLAVEKEKKAIDEGEGSYDKLIEASKTLADLQGQLTSAINSTAGAFDYLASKGISASQIIIDAMEAAGMALDEQAAAYAKIGRGGGGYSDWTDDSDVGWSNVDVGWSNSSTGGWGDNSSTGGWEDNSSTDGWEDYSSTDGWGDHGGTVFGAEGLSFVTNGPTPILAGEGSESELVQITPLSKLGRRGEGVIINFNAPIYGIDDINNAIDSALNRVYRGVKSLGG